MRDFRKIRLRRDDLTFTALEEGEKDAPIVLCLHGFPDHNRSWRHQLPALAEAGYRAVAPMLRGYEPDAQPKDRDYHLVRAVEDVLAWLDDLGREKVHLVGHDWGAAIGYVTVAKAPARFASLTTLAVPYRFIEGVRHLPSQIRNSWYMFFFQLRGIAEVTVEAGDFAFIEKLWSDWSPGWKWPEQEMEALKTTFSRRGVTKAALSYYRQAFDFWGRAGRQTQRLMRAKVPVPTLALTGATDGCIDTRLYDLLMQERDFPAGLRVERIQGAGHFLHQEKPGEVNALLLEWLAQHPTGEPLKAKPRKIRMKV